ncbi:TetR/AcrR family transcriptional regulator [Chelativorans salis]|uniref:WHG domain-containing protein n=1 Tax=Chelativorans salis TaxID=2978478 RepID=A0ABT2LGM0_9HYPH|nr:WHG domain-containing protein [Chelativorans sp. EGI FJ00035]MCT7373655.1 WHG domain-containing protein [Chelativorans sp. EGI FJ00035]
MPRKMKVNREDLPEIVLDVAGRFAAREGLRGVAMRRIAQEVGVVPGSIYNVVGDIDEIVLRLNARTLRRLQEHLRRAADPQGKAAANTLAFAEAYLDFVAANPRLWGVILEHTMPGGEPIPGWYAAELDQTTGLVDRVLEPLFPDEAERTRTVTALWAALHGLASLATSGKLSVLNDDDPRDLARLMVTRFLKLDDPAA